jgi:hypothetical protein
MNSVIYFCMYEDEERKGTLEDLFHLNLCFKKYVYY